MAGKAPLFIALYGIFSARAVPGPRLLSVLGIEEIGFVVVVWGVTALLFRDWVVKFDLALRERLTGDYFNQQAVDEQRTLLERTGRVVLAAGILDFALGVGLRLARLS